MVACTSHSVIAVDQVSKAYGTVRAVANVSFDVRAGEIFGLLGPNGAGKTTTLAIVEGLRAPDQGRATVLGFDVAQHARQIKARIGVQLQATSLLPYLSAIEQVELFARLYGRHMHRRTALDLLARLALEDKAHALPTKMSGGQQQRLALALALVNDPEIVFLDEPTAGLDPQARRMLWDIVRCLRDGRTVVLTTHGMEEAEALCHRVGIRTTARCWRSTRRALINQLHGVSRITTAAALSADQLDALAGVRRVERDGDLLRLHTDDVAATNGALFALAQHANVSLRDLHVQQPSLEDVFLHLTGRSLREA